MLSRRGLLFGAAAVAAPAIIRPGILMPVKRILMPDDGVALQSVAHPHSNLVTRDLTEESLLELMMEVKRGYEGGLIVQPRFIHFP
jgi:hypothetical protein